MFPKITPSKNFQIIALKLLHDALLILAVLFFGLLLMESVLPGLISGHIGLWIVAGSILINIGLISWLSEKLAITNPLKEAKTTPTPSSKLLNSTDKNYLNNSSLQQAIGFFRRYGTSKKEVFILLLIFFIFIFNGVLRINWLLGAIISLLASLAGLLVFFFVQKTD